MAEGREDAVQNVQRDLPASVQEHAQSLREQGYDVSVRDGAVVADVPNPRPTDDDYFHGDNPHKAGFGSRPAATEGAAGDLTVDPGESTADAQAKSGGAGWNVNAGSDPQTGGGASSSGEPDESWTNARLRDYADQQGVETHASMNKGELLDAIRSRGSSGGGQDE